MIKVRKKVKDLANKTKNNIIVISNFDSNLKNLVNLNHNNLIEKFQNLTVVNLNTNQSDIINRSSKTWITVGKLLKPIGNNGLIKILSNTDYPDIRFRKGSKLYLKNSKYSSFPFPIQIENFIHNIQKREIYIKLFGFNTREELLEIIGSELVIPKEERITPTDPNAYYPDELEGMLVIDSCGKQIGTVLYLDLKTPSPYLSITTIDNGEILVPYRTEFIEEISRKTKTIKLKHSLEFHIPI